MSLKNRLFVSAIMVVFNFSAMSAQEFTDQGMFSGSGLTIIPTATIAPPSEFRLQYSRMDLPERSHSGINIVSLSTGFSSSLEGYSRFTSEQAGTAVSQETYGFGLKLHVPVDVPVLRRLAFWVERTISDRSDPAALYPTDALRTGAIATLDSNGIRPTFFIGMSSLNSRIYPLVGAGVTIAASHNAQIGFEAMNGYFGQKSYQVAATGSVRIFSNMSIHASPGYLSTPGVSSWTISLGISCATTDIDFHPIFLEQKGDEITLPSIEDIEKQEKQPQKNPGDGGALQNDAPQDPTGQGGPSENNDSPDKLNKKNNLSTLFHLSTQQRQEEHAHHA